MCRYQVKLDEGFDNIIVVDGVPVIDKSKLDKLLTKIAKEFTRKGAAIRTDDITMPFNEQTGKSNGCAPICVKAPQAASSLAKDTYLWKCKMPKRRRTPST
jgi:translation initiation factor 3 subunit B